MTRPEFTPEPSTGQQREREKAEKDRIATQFRTGIDALLNKHAEDVENTLEARTLRVQSIGLAFEGKNSDYNIIVTRKTPLSGKEPSKYYMVITDSPKTEGETGIPATATEYDYSLEEDGEVKRVEFNMRDRMARIREAHGYDQVDTLDPFSDHTLAEVVEDEAISAQMKSELGIADLNVGLKEVDQITKIAEQGTLLPVSFNDLYIDHFERRAAEPVDTDEAERGSSRFNHTIKELLSTHASQIEQQPFGEDATEKSVTIGDNTFSVTYGSIKKGADQEHYFIRTHWRRPGEILLFNFLGMADGVMGRLNSIPLTDDLPGFETDTTLGLRDVNRLSRFLHDPHVDVPLS